MTVAVGLAALSALSGQARATDAPLAARDWNVNGSSGSLQAKPPSDADVLAFLGGLGQENIHLCDFRIADLDMDGRYELVASIDYSGRQFCNTVLVVGPGTAKAANFFVRTVQAWNVSNVGSMYTPDGPGGRITLAVPQPLTDYDGAECVATWPVLYRLDHGRLNDVSAAPEFHAFYRSQYDALGSEAGAGAFGGKPASPASPVQAKKTITDPNAPCKLITLDKLARFLGFHATAGLDRAQLWMNSGDTALRRKAVRVFADIGTDAAQSSLVTMSHDRDPVVAQSARLELAHPAGSAAKLNWGQR
jgi:hypothetical protein